MKNFKKYLDIAHLIKILRKHPAHLHHAYALFFAGFFTVIAACAVLYFEYGFWHERYSRTEEIKDTVVHDDMVTIQSPSELTSSFFKEAVTKFKEVDLSADGFLKGKDVYKKSDEGEISDQ